MSRLITLATWAQTGGLTGPRTAATSMPSGPEGVGWHRTGDEVRIFSPDDTPPAGTVALVRWYSAERDDHHTTSHPSWRDRFEEVRSPGYRFARIEGYVFERAQLGTRTLQHYYDASTRDNILAIGPRPIDGARAGRIEGYAPSWTPDSPDVIGFGQGARRGRRPVLLALCDLEDRAVDDDDRFYEQLFWGGPSHSHEGTVPLLRWYSPERVDYWTSTAPSDGGGKSAQPVRLSDYRFSGFEGYLRAPRINEVVIGMVGLYRWTNEAKKNALATTDPPWAGVAPPVAGWNARTLLGRVYDPSRPAPPRSIPLHHWRADGDDVTTTHPSWRGGPGQRRGAYRWVRLEGFVSTVPFDGSVELFRWYSAGRNDNRLATEPSWVVDRRHELYHLERIDGRVFDPAQPQPPGTLALHTWWDVARDDHLTTSDPAMRPEAPPRGFRHVRLEGYVYHPDRPGTATLPVARYRSPDGAHTLTTVLRSAGPPASSFDGWALDRLEGHAIPRRLPTTGPAAQHVNTVSRGVFSIAPTTPRLVRVRLPMTTAEVRAQSSSLGSDTAIVREVAAQSAFDYRSHATGGHVTPDDMSIVAVIPVYTDGELGGQARTTSVVRVDGVQAQPGLVVISGDFEAGFFAHETLHSTAGLLDIYGPSEQVNRGASVMASPTAAGYDVSHIGLDPWHAIRAGWVAPMLQRMSDPGMSTLLSDRPVVLFDPRRGPDEWFAVEVRGPSRRSRWLDAHLPGVGAFVWHVKVAADGKPVHVTWPRDSAGDVIYDVRPAADSRGAGDAKAVYTIGPDGTFGTATLWSAPSGPIQLWWSDGTPTGVVLRITAGDTRSVWLEWNRISGPRVPTIAAIRAAPPAGRPGPLNVTGRFPAAAVDLRVTAPDGAALSVGATSSTFWSASAEIAPGRAGRYEVMAVARESGAVSNAWRFERE